MPMPCDVWDESDCLTTTVLLRERSSIAGALWNVLCSHALKPGASEKVTQLHFKGEEVFIKEVYEKVKNWWDQSEARKLKRVALEAPQRNA